MKYAIAIAVLCVCGFLMGASLAKLLGIAPCVSAPPANVPMTRPYISEPEAARLLCIEKGGVPTLGWEGGYRSCTFPGDSR